MNVFHKTWIYGLLLLALAGCVSCSMGGKKGEAEDLIETAGDAGCNIESIKFEDGQVKQIDCHETVRFVR